MMNKRGMQVILVFAIVLTLAVACAPTPQVVEKVVVKETVVVTQVVEKVVTATPEPKAPGGGTFVGSYDATLDGLDPQTCVSYAGTMLLAPVYEALVAMNKDGEWEGVLAESWETSDDGLTWTVHLRKGVKFHNGREMTADDVIYNFQRIIDENTGAASRSLFANKFVSYEAVDPYTVKFILTGGSSTFLSELGLAMRNAIIAQECVTKDGYIVHPIGTGPFEFVSWKPGEEFRVKRFDDYWGEVAKIDEAVFKYIPDDTVRLTALQTGEIDWVDVLPLEQAAKMLENPSDDIVIKKLLQSYTMRLDFNTTRPPFDDARVRQAVAYAIDKEEYNEAIWFGLGNPHNQPFAPDSFLYIEADDPYRTSDVEKARSLLVEAGYPNGFEINVISDNANKAEWELLQSYLSQIDITVNVELMDWAQWLKQAQAMEYDAQLCHQGAIYHWDRVFGYFVKDSGANWLVGGYHNDAVAELLAVARNESDLSKAKETYAQILQIIQDDAAAVFIGAPPAVYTWRSWVKGYDPAPGVPSTVWPGGGLNYVTLDEKP